MPYVLRLVCFIKVEGVFEESLGSVELCSPVKHQTNVRVNCRHFWVTFTVNQLQQISSAIKKFQ